MIDLASIYQYLNYFVRLNTGAATPFPQVIFLEATKRCYLRCEMCDIWRMEEDGSTDLTLPQLESFFDDCQRHRVRLINIYGGEPLVRKDICQVVEACSVRGIPTSLTTAGPPLTQTMAGRLGRAGLGVLNVSLDSPDRDLHDRLRGKAGTFDKAIRAVRLMQQWAPQTQVGLNFTIMKVNFRSIPEMIRLAESLGVSFVKFFPIHTTWPQDAKGGMNRDLLFTSEEDTRQLQAVLAEARPMMKQSTMHFMSDTFLETIPYHHLPANPHVNKCFAAKLTCEVQANGDVLSCLQRPLVLGNLKQQKLSDMWASRQAKAIRGELEGCTDCQLCCYIEPALRYRPKFLLREPGTLWKEYKLYSQHAYRADHGAIAHDLRESEQPAAEEDDVRDALLPAGVTSLPIVDRHACCSADHAASAGTDAPPNGGAKRW